MNFSKEFFEPEVRCGFYVSSMMKRVWAAELQTLEDIDSVCKKHNITYFADWGTLLGAVRHKGFIPWDDDVDICMLREDYEKFIRVAPDELKEWYEVSTFKRKDTSSDMRNFSIFLHSGENLRVDAPYLEHFHNYPYIAGVDIFPLDYMAPTAEDDEKQIEAIRSLVLIAERLKDCTEEKRKSYIRQVEEAYHVKFDNESTIEIQLYRLADKVFAANKGENSQFFVPFTFHAFGKERYRFPKRYYKNFVRIPFENMLIPVPALFEEVLKVEFGDYKKLIRQGSAHHYPIYCVQEEEFKDRFGFSIAKIYDFQENDMIREKSNSSSSLKTLAQNMMGLLQKVHENIIEAIDQNRIDDAAILLEQCQESAILLGNNIEKVKQKEYVTVQLLEQYCENLYIAHETLLGYMEANLQEAIRLLQEKFEEVKESVCIDIVQRKDVVFLPFKASAWDSFADIWAVLKENPDIDIHVVPIPYYYKSFEGKLENICFEPEKYSDDLNVKDYESFDFGLCHPDMIFIHNPYDMCDAAISIPPFFYSDNLRGFTDNLIYTPYFQVEEFDSEDERAVYNMRYYCLMPGVVRADKVIVQSEKMRELYIDELVRFSDKRKKEIWDNKILTKSSQEWEIFLREI